MQMAYTTSVLLQLAVSFVISSSLLLPAYANYGYGRNPPVRQSDGAAKEMKVNKLLPIGFQGMILCKPPGSRDAPRPLQGASARITCVAEDEHGYETAPFSLSSTPTDDKGYYFATLYLSELMMSHDDSLKLKQCKAFLESSSELDTCNYPTDENGGITGATLTSYTILEEKHMKLYTVKPFFYSSTAGPASPPLPAADDDYE